MKILQYRTGESGFPRLKCLSIMVKALFIWDVPDPLRNYLVEGLKDSDGIDLLFPAPAEEDQFLKLCPDAGIIVGWRPTPEQLDNARQLRLFINPGAGVRHHMVNFRRINRERNVVLVNGHGNTYFTAQHGVALLLTLMNKVIQHHEWMMDGKWRTGDSDAPSIPLRDRHVGFLGYGAVNSKIHKMLSGFDLRFSALKRHPDPIEDPPTPIEQYTEDDLHLFLKEIDILFVGVPETTRTISMIGTKELELLGKEGLVVNLARGRVIDEASLFDSLWYEKVAGAAIDVWYEYTPEADDEGKKWPWNYGFLELDNIVLSPHRAASPMNDLGRWDEVIENIKRFASGRTDFLNIVDLEEGY